MSSADASLNTVRRIAEAAAAAGGRALVIGGWVCDLLRGHPSKDIDIEIFGIPEERLPALLAPISRVEPVGQSFPVYKVVPPGGSAGEIDVALPRRESKRGRGHKGFEVHGDPSMNVAEAARRRDFTINAISWDPIDETYEDPFDGRTDLADSVLRAVDLTTFGEDSLRVLRAVEQRNYDIILMDCHMPEVDGYEATRRIRTREEQEPSGRKGRRPAFIIAVTASAMAEDRERCLEVGMDAYVSKPIELDELQRALERFEALAEDGTRSF